MPLESDTPYHIVRCAQCKRYMRTEWGAEAIMSAQLKEYCDNCEIAEEELLDAIQVLGPICDRLQPLKWKGQELKWHGLSAAENQAISKFEWARKNYDIARSSLANLRMRQLRMAEKKAAAGMGSSIQNLPFHSKQARSPSPRSDARPNKRVRLDETGKKSEVTSKDAGFASCTGRKVSFTEPPVFWATTGYRDMGKFCRSSAYYVPGRHSASPGFTLLDTSGCSWEYEVFYYSDDIDDKDDNSDDEESNVEEMAELNHEDFDEQTIREIEEEFARVDDDPLDHMASGVALSCEADTDDLGGIDADPSELVLYHDHETDEGFVMEHSNPEIHFDQEDSAESSNEPLGHNCGSENEGFHTFVEGDSAYASFFEDETTTAAGEVLESVDNLPSN